MADLMRQYITKTPGVCGGRACIAGHRIRVMDIVVWYERRLLTPAEIAVAFPGITLAEVHAALAYYYDNREEIAADFRYEEEVEAAHRDKSPSFIREYLHGRPDSILPG